MNKYQKQALVDMLKFTAGIMLLIAVVQTLAKYFGQEALTVAGSVALMIFCLYNLFQIRVDQLKSEDESQTLVDRYNK
jgi:Ca2+/H+ antiporter